MTTVYNDDILFFDGINILDLALLNQTPFYLYSENIVYKCSFDIVYMHQSACPRPPSDPQRTPGCTLAVRDYVEKRMTKPSIAAVIRDYASQHSRG